MYKIKVQSFFLTLLFISVPMLASPNTEKPSKLEEKYPIIPIPKKANYGKNEVFFSHISINSKGFDDEKALLESYLNINGIRSDQNGFVIEFIKTEEGLLNNEEAYQLSIGEKVQVFAAHEKGAFYAVQTLKQLLRFKEQKATLPKAEIEDWPSFKIRGFMHDTGRNFQSIGQLKEQIEIMALYKYNIFHWHLTDNPGWRLESKIYPQLQDPAVTSREKGKFYSQEDFKEILAFCKDRHITVIPELDIPGHTEAFRKAFDIETMRDPKVAPILNDLFNELCDLADSDEMPFIHIGTDEVKSKIESVNHAVILNLMNLLNKRNREVIVWKQGIVVKKDSTSINQLWAQHKGRKGHRFIDSRSNYINHMDPFAGMARLYFQQPAGQPQGDALALGGILCAWPDNLTHERDILKQNPIYPSMVFYSDAIWNGRAEDKRDYWSKLPEPESQDWVAFQNFENKVITHRDRFFQNKEFPYVAQSDIQWNLLGPLDHKGDVNKEFEIESVIKSNYQVNGKQIEWKGPFAGATIHLKHFFGFKSFTQEKEGTYYAYSRIYSPEDRKQDFWVGFQGWSRSSRRGGPTASQGQWHRTNPKIWVNGNEIAPPVWKQPGLDEKDSEIAYVDEDYFYRDPTQIELKKGWNEVLLKIPQGEKSWKWMFTCVPISKKGKDIREEKSLKFKAEIK